MSLVGLKLLGLNAVAALIYATGMVGTVLMQSTPDDVVLIWPSSGIAFSLLLVYGWRILPHIPVGIAVGHWVALPVPDGFLIYSMASNTIGLAAGYALAVQITGPDRPRLTLADGLKMMACGAVAAFIGGLIGSIGLTVHDMSPADTFAGKWLKWALGDILGIAVFSPLASLVATRFRDGPPPANQATVYGGGRERLAWLVLFVLSLAALWYSDRIGEAYLFPIAAVPTVALVWSALRFEPLYTALATVPAIGLTAMRISSGLVERSEPTTTMEASVLLLYLTLLTVMPLLLVAVSVAQRRALTKLVERVTRDRLTGLPNREGLERWLERDWNGAEPAVLGYLDIDQFSTFNDACGHHAGDQLVRQLASVMRAELAESALLARLGGDEFLIVWPDTSVELARAQAQALLRSIEGFRFPFAQQVYAMSASLGLSMLSRGDRHAERTIVAAEIACQAAKDQGGNRVRVGDVHDTDFQTRLEAVAWLPRLNQAFARERFVLYAQPLQALRGAPGHNLSLEVLVRLNEGDEAKEGLVSPSSFIPAAERFNLIARLDRYVIEHTLRAIDLAPASVVQRLERVSINLSGRTLNDDMLGDWILDRVSRSALKPRQLCFEITETAAIADLAKAAALIRKLRAHGYSFALDDFGAGFCSFGYLSDLPVDVLKIDGQFVRDLDRNPLHRAVVRAMVDIARTIGMQTVAECAERIELLPMIDELGVNYAQGFAIAKPAPLATWLRPAGPAAAQAHEPLPHAAGM